MAASKHTAPGHAPPPEESSFPPFESEWFASQLFWLAISFGLLYLILSRYILPRISAVIEQRQDRIAKDLDEADRLRIGAEKSVRQRQQKLQGAHKQAREKIAEAKAQAEQDAAQRNEVLIKTLDAKIDAEQTKVNAQRMTALNSIDQAVQDAASAMICKLTGHASPDAKALKAASADAVKTLVH